MTEKVTGRDRGDSVTRKRLLQQIHADFPGNCCDAQRARLQAAMREAGWVTTTEARLYLEIMNPAQRISELRDHGEQIDTAWTAEPSEAGRAPHRMARYVMCPKPAGGIAAELAALLVLAAVAGLLLVGVA